MFLLSRETPIYSLQYIILSFGGQFYLSEDDVPEGTEITHIVMDRPLPASMKLKKCEYVQPQYLADCANNIHLLPTAAYKPGIPPPAHLSPFVDGKKEGYMPRREQEIRMLKGEEVVAEESSDDNEAAASSDEEEEEVKPAAKKQVKQSTEKAKGDADSSSGDDDDMNEEEDTAKTKADIAKMKQERAAANKKLKEDLEKEQKEMGKVLMTNRQRKLYQQAADEAKEKKAVVKKLKTKRKIIEKRK